MHEWPDTSESLVLRVRDPEDGAAWSQFLAIYRPVVYRLARSRGFQHADADDLAQQVFESIARAVDRWEPGEDAPRFRAWLYRIARNAIVDAIRRRKPDAAAGSTSIQAVLNATPESDEAIESALRRESRLEAFGWATREIVHEFAETTWAMFWETAVDGRSIAEVAKSHGRSRGAVYVARYRVLQRIKEKVDDASGMWSE